MHFICPIFVVFSVFDENYHVFFGTFYFLLAVGDMLEQKCFRHPGFRLFGRLIISSKRLYFHDCPFACLFLSRIMQRLLLDQKKETFCICTMCVCTCVRACVTQFSLKLLQLHIFGKSQVLMNFFALQYFWGLVNFGLLLSE